MTRALTLLIVLAAPAALAQIVHPDAAGASLFLPSSQCIACHSNLTDASGADVSIGYNWRASMMANSARDPYWHAGVRRELIDHPEAQSEIEDICSTCHMPAARYEATHRGSQGRVFASLHDPLAMDGVSCTVCHQIDNDNFGEPESFDGGFVIDTSRPVGERNIYGPYEIDPGRQRVMHSSTQFVPAETTHLAASELCATCHTLYTRALDAAGGGEEANLFAEQMPYREWLQSDFRQSRSCQDCHMPELAQATPIASVLGAPRPRFSEHSFIGGNAFMLRVLNKYRDELGVTALPQELSVAVARTEAYLGSASARLSITAVRSGAALTAAVTIENLSGHKLPTAYPSRRVWLHVVATDAAGTVLFESGALRPDGSIAGNDNDTDPARYEPHYERIDAPSQVQIYEPVLVDRAGAPTTGLLSATRYIKDNRLLPSGFDKRAAPWDVAVLGAALEDADFEAGGDRIEYRIPIAEARGSVTVTAELLYQSIGFRWAENLKPYDAPEPQRFVRYYAETSASSAVTLARASVLGGG